MDLSSAETRRVTLVGISDDEEGMTKQRVYRDGKPVTMKRNYVEAD